MVSPPPSPPPPSHHTSPHTLPVLQGLQLWLNSGGLNDHKANYAKMNRELDAVFRKLEALEALQQKRSILPAPKKKVYETFCVNPEPSTEQAPQSA